MNSERARELATKALQMSAACKEFADQLDNARRHVEPYRSMGEVMKDFAVIVGLPVLVGVGMMLFFSLYR